MPQRRDAAVDVDLPSVGRARVDMGGERLGVAFRGVIIDVEDARFAAELQLASAALGDVEPRPAEDADRGVGVVTDQRSEEHTSELQSLMRISYAVFCLKQKKKDKNKATTIKD